MSTVPGALADRAAATPHALAFECRGDAVSYGDLLDQTLRMASVLAGHGVRSGERCALVLPTGLDFVRAFYGILFTGAAAAPFSPTLVPELAAARAALVQARLLIAPQANAGSLSAALAARGDATRVVAIERCMADAAGAPRLEPPALDRHAPALLEFTSGTLGEPKAAVIPHRAAAAYLEGFAATTSLGPRDVQVTWTALHHNTGLMRTVCAGPFIGYACHLLPPGAGTLQEWLGAITRARATLTGASDYWYRAAAQRIDPSSVNLSSLRIAVTGAEAVRLRTIEEFERRFDIPGVMRPAYGLSETTSGATYMLPGEPLRVDERGFVAVGRPQPGVAVRIVDAGGTEQPPGCPGEICVRGDTLFTGYFGDEAATREVLRAGWLHTGDEGKLDADGFLYVVGRMRALIKRAGVTIVPREVEDAADRVEGVTGSAAVGAHDQPSDLEQLVVVAEVRPEDSAGAASHAAILHAIGHEVARAVGVAPSRVVIVAPGRIPRTENGKVRYAELRRLAALGALE